MRIANSPAAGHRPDLAARLVAHAASIEVRVWELAAEPERVPGLTRAAVKALPGVHGDDGGAARTRTGRTAVAELLAAVLADTGYVKALEAEGTIEAEGRIENLEQLVEVAREFDASAGPARTRSTPSCSRWRSRPRPISRSGRQEGEGDELDEADRGALTLMTLHNAKGTRVPRGVHHRAARTG